MSIVALARPAIRALQAYEAAQQVDDTVRLNANESPYVVPAGRFRRPLNRYPEVRPRRLQQLLAERFGCQVGQLLVTRGSSEAIDLLVRVFCEAERDKILVSSPSFSMYKHYAAVQGAGVTEVPALPADDFAIDIDALIAACDAATRLIFVCSPNNPTGAALPGPALEKLLAARRGRSAVVVDEAYIEFGKARSATGLLGRYDNLIVLRTLSKALGFAGARCGAASAHESVISVLDAVQAPYAMATPVVECVEDALGANQLAAAERAVVEIVRERERLADALAKFDLVRKVWPSEANFLLVRVDDAEAVMAGCRERKVLLRYFGGDLSDCIRISVGSREENDRLLEALASLREGP